jgi:hypothetical protein
MDEELNGVIERIVFSNEENGYSVVKLKGKLKDEIQIVGLFYLFATGRSHFLQRKMGLSSKIWKAI